MTKRRSFAALEDDNRSRSFAALEDDNKSRSFAALKDDSGCRSLASLGMTGWVLGMTVARILERNDA
jgi:hypothetical protein